MLQRLLLGAALAGALAAPAAAQNHCSHDAVTIHGVPVAIGLCITRITSSSTVATVDLAASYASKNGSFTQRSGVRFITGEGPARALESVNLAPLGIAGVLHMTLLYDGNEVTMEHALLTPGAIAVK